MASNLFGECLGKIVPISAHDVEEILEHQAATRQKFGEIALAWGLCRPQHIWQAWWDQLSQQTPMIDLNKIGVDAQAASLVPAEVAVQFRAVPLRCHRNQIVIATCESGLSRARAELPNLLKLQLQFALADEMQLDYALRAYYPNAFRRHVEVA